MSTMSPQSREAFVERYGGVYEHSPWVAELCYEQGKALSPGQLAPMFAACVDAADRETRLELIRAHPDLADRLGVAGLTEASQGEQASAGLDRCTAEEFEAFTTLNAEYKQRFGFPFVMAVRNSNRAEILDAFRRRVGNAPDVEFRTAIAEIHQIARLRLEALS